MGDHVSIFDQDHQTYRNAVVLAGSQAQYFDTNEIVHVNAATEWKMLSSPIMPRNIKHTLRTAPPRQNKYGGVTDDDFVASTVYKAAIEVIHADSGVMDMLEAHYIDRENIVLNEHSFLGSSAYRNMVSSTPLAGTVHFFLF